MVQAIKESDGIQRDMAQEEENRKIVVEFFERAFVRHEVRRAAELLSDDYKQHAPTAATGRASFIEHFIPYLEANPESRGRLVRSATDADLVFIHFHWKVNPEDRGLAIVDIFRVRNGLIVEHWDVLQEVPTHSKNDNGMF